LTSVVIDGARTELGPTSGDALVYAGGSSRGQVIAHNVIRDTRTWSSLHLIEGGGPAPCADALVEDNDIGPAGTSDNWADGISLACTTSTVRGNRITDATDGGIVVFGAPGSVIEGNTVTAASRIMLGGINLVDVGPYEGDYSGTIVRDNLIDAAGAVIRIGLGMGGRVWGCLTADDPGPLPYGATVTSNTLRGTKMQYGYAVSGVADWTVTGNTDAARHAGKPTVACGTTVAGKPAGFQINADTATGTFQREFTAARLDLALWAIVDPRPGQ
jgi:parallel beta-helix repeat protein